MAAIYKLSKDTNNSYPTLYIINKPTELNNTSLNKKEISYCKAKFKDDQDLVEINLLDRHIFVVKVSKKDRHAQLEALRMNGSKVCDKIHTEGYSHIQVIGEDVKQAAAAAEGIALANYQFIKYFNDKKKRTYKLQQILIHCDPMKSKDLKELEAVTQGVYHARNLVNEPLSYLTATALSKEIQSMGTSAGFKVEVLRKKKIESLKMGGLLAVNKGSVDPPTFSILEWKPKKCNNKKPIVLVGKGVVYDTGGVSLKPTANSMDLMKSDMGGAAMMAATMYAVAKAKLPVHVIALIPATDNRPGLNAYVPGDVITMHSGLTVEVLNTDAEGRMLLADALSFAKKYKPELVLDSATLTGAAIRAIGTKASCIMGTATDKTFDTLIDSGFETHERVVRMPFWDDYGDQIKSDIADIKNLGGANAGQITAGKFLEKFTDYPWIHIDIAGPAFISARDGYRSKWATGVGVRLMFDFLKKY